MIEIQHFYKAYSSQKNKEFAVQDVSFNVTPGKITGLLGPNGSGKTTIMKAVCGFHYPTKGSIKVSGVEVSENPEKAMKLIGYVPEISVLPGDMTVMQLLKYVAKLHEVEDADKAIEKVISQCSLNKLTSKKIKTLSKGQQQRVSFAQCLVYNPENLILDEPVSGLDPAQIQQMRSLIKELSAEKAILLSTHILQEVHSLCDEVYILADGKIVAGGTAEHIAKVSDSKDLEEAFIKLTKESSADEE